MRPLRIRTYAWLGITGCFVGCAMPKPPGELVGVYAIEGSLTKNECGTDALPAADPLSFDVELRKEDGTGYWLQGMPPAWPGLLSEDGTFSFELEQSYAVDPKARVMPDPFSSMDPEALADPTVYEKLDQAMNGQPCSLRIVESLDGTVLRDLSARGHASMSGPAPDESSSPDLVGDNSIAISAAEGDCGLVMRDQGGPFEALPCTAHYDLVGAMVRDEK